ncbi:MAG: GNAT family N-acetyltransferase [Chitinispirillaceae bacterium]|nr:GNAT family N-acetyltransferase [Chitinispirillaceae bacterium]
MPRLEECKLLRLTLDTKIKPFDCGDSDLNGFLFDDAHDYLKELFAVTYLWEYGDDTVAFFSVSNDRIVFNEKTISKTEWNRFERKIPNLKRGKDNPAVKIGRLGVNQKYQNQKIGTELLTYIKHLFLDKNKTGCRFITVDAYNKEPVLSFYEKNGFIHLTENDKDAATKLMYFDLSRFAKSIAEIEKNEK